MKYTLALLIIAAAVLTGCGTQQDSENTEAPVERAQEMSAGKRLFLNNCAQCHAITQDKVGPRLEGVMAKWDNDTARISAFIQNAEAVIESGDKRAVKVYNDWSNALMTPMPHLSNGDINSILEYINEGKD